MIYILFFCFDIFFSRFDYHRRYRDKERTNEPAPPASVVTTAPRATTPSESKKSSINVTVNPKSLSSNAATKSAKVSKRIDMGAATNFGRDELGINSPTHRNTHSEEDLFATGNTIPAAAASTAHKSDLDDIFKTCSTTTNAVSNTVSSQSNNLDDDDFFNPRSDDTQEFGDFASAFGTATPAQSQPEQFATNDTKKNDFADFSAAFTSEQPQPEPTLPSSSTSNTTSNDPANFELFAINSTPNAQITASNSSSNPKVGDLLSDLDGLSLDVSVPTGKSATLFPYILCLLLLVAFAFFSILCFCFAFILNARSFLLRTKYLTSFLDCVVWFKNKLFLFSVTFNVEKKGKNWFFS